MFYLLMVKPSDAVSPQDTGSSVLQDKVLISEFVSVDGLSSSTIVVGEVTSLAHEPGNDTVEG